jgi:hypothetical protein
MQSADGETQELDAEAAQNKADQSEEATLPKQAAAPKMKISLEKYQAITLSIVRYLRQQEEATATLTATGDAQGDDDEDDPDEESFGKIPQAKVVQWHLDQNSGEFESEDMVEHERALVNKVDTFCLRPLSCLVSLEFGVFPSTFYWFLYLRLQLCLYL